MAIIPPYDYDISIAANQPNNDISPIIDMFFKYKQIIKKPNLINGI
jgi:hypothetical protein